MHTIDFPLVGRGKVRDIYEISDKDMLIIHTTNRVSAFDVVLPTLIPQKGRILNQTSLFWFEKTKHIIENHIVEPHDELVKTYAPWFTSEAMIVRKLTPLPIEAVVRGYLSGSGWNDYVATGQVCGIPLPEGLQKSSKLPEVIYTPATKAPPGFHDENISFEQTKEMLRPDLAEFVRDTSIQLYKYAADYALRRGIILADTKFEFGMDDDTGNIYLIDEALTPDSSRYWDTRMWVEGIEPPSFDKQFVRNYLLSIGWNKQPPGPELPPRIVRGTTEAYEEILFRLLRPENVGR